MFLFLLKPFYRSVEAVFNLFQIHSLSYGMNDSIQVFYSILSDTARPQDSKKFSQRISA